MDDVGRLGGAKRRRRGELYIEDFTRVDRDKGDGAEADWLADRYLAESHEDVYGEVEREFLDLPDTTEREHVVITLMYEEYNRTQIAAKLGLTRREISVVVKSIRDKLAAIRPVYS